MSSLLDRVKKLEKSLNLSNKQYLFKICRSEADYINHESDYLESDKNNDLILVCIY